MFGINGPEFLVLALVALLVVGPERLPKYASQLARLVREGRRMATGAREQVRAELGPEFDDIDWKKLDPRQYDPRRIVREALSDTFDDPPKRGRTGDADGAGRTDEARGTDSTRDSDGARDVGTAPGPAPFDSEAT